MGSRRQSQQEDEGEEDGCGTKGTEMLHRGSQFLFS